MTEHTKLPLPLRYSYGSEAGADGADVGYIHDANGVFVAEFERGPRGDGRALAILRACNNFDQLVGISREALDIVRRYFVMVGFEENRVGGNIPDIGIIQRMVTIIEAAEKE